jgi:hypothetical protein
LWEEVGIHLPDGTLRLAWSGTLPFESRQDAVEIWETSVKTPPALHVAGHEIIWAGWVNPSEALGRRLLPHVAIYLAGKSEKGENVRRV